MTIGADVCPFGRIKFESLAFVPYVSILRYENLNAVGRFRRYLLTQGLAVMRTMKVRNRP